MKKRFKRRTIIEVFENFNAKGLFFNYYVRYTKRYIKRIKKMYIIRSFSQLSKGQLLCLNYQKQPLI